MLSHLSFIVSKMASKKTKSTDESDCNEGPKDLLKKKRLSNGAAVKDKLDSSSNDIDSFSDISENGLVNNSLSENDTAHTVQNIEADEENCKTVDKSNEDKNLNGKVSVEKNLRSEYKRKMTRSASKENKKTIKDDEDAKDLSINSKVETPGLENNISVEKSDKKKDSHNKDSKDEEIDLDGKQVANEKSGTGEKENKEKQAGEKSSSENKKSKQSEKSDNGTDDIEIIGESKVVKVSTSNTLLTQNVVFVPAALTSSVTSHNIITQGFTATHSSLLTSPSLQSSVVTHGVSSASAPPVQGLNPAFLTANVQGNYAFNSGIPAPGISLLTPTVAPPKPKSSLDQIELIRWEIQNRINTRPKYFKPNSSSELGPLAKFLFDIGSDLIKESVYHELVKIQSKKGEDEKLTDKEKEDLNKLKEIEKDLYATIGHLKLKLKKHCKGCNYQTESENVMYLHKQYPHEDGKNLRCAHCSFSTRQAMTFKFHIEAEHNVQPKLPEKRAFYECDLCPYENNQEQKLILHKQRCIKQFRPLFNLHPGCLSGAEINLCLENIFYKPVIPKNLKLLQQKHAQQQAALAEARRQQAQVQALAAQKNAAALAAKKQQQQQPRMQAVNGPQLNFQNAARPPLTKLPVQQPPVRYSAANVKTPRPTVANILNNRQAQGVSQGIAPGGFEVCEICSGYVKDRKALRIHFFYAHRIDLPFNLFERNQAPLYCATCYVRFWTAQGLRKHIETHKGESQARGVVGKCISCFEHVTNLLLHMRVVHNRELQHYINALMCMFCGGHFSTRQECERHIIRAHGIIDPLTGAVKVNGTTTQVAQSKPSATPKKTPGSNTLVKGSVCVLCNLNFGRNVDLTRHCMRMHHTCMKCGMVVIDKASLLKHTCLSSPSGTRDCCMCSETGFHPAYYVKHLRDKHLKKFSIKVHKLSKDVIERWTKRPYSAEDSKEILVEISDSEDDVKQISKPNVSPIKRPRMGPACKVRKPLESQPKVESEVVRIEDDSNDDDVVVEKVELGKRGKLLSDKDTIVKDSAEKAKPKVICDENVDKSIVINDSVSETTDDSNITKNTDSKGTNEAQNNGKDSQEKNDDTSSGQESKLPDDDNSKLSHKRKLSEDPEENSVTELSPKRRLSEDQEDRDIKASLKRRLSVDDDDDADRVSPKQLKETN
ncbi:MOG interacting and ectopic P-granules protein 1-like isoform X1 [Biomphalaria glabrata]|uniref:MOG interacting and ectopic P-granules protein 1-like isoform X1 n=2 Tax=Biomphalaria glabrata TaxID=6526 RepID=A0A9U8DWR7_BIOGL|nr:MOG interacting and ectopic P-granules protein 1-like isoform X1 [Biomphalaria glabrata]